MALMNEIKSLKEQGYTLDEVYQQLVTGAPYWLVKVLYSLA